MALSFFGFGQSADIDIVLDGHDTRRTAEIKTEDGRKERHYLYYDGESVSGKVNVTLKRPGAKLEHQGIKIEFVGQIVVGIADPWPHAPAKIFEHDVVRSIVGDAALLVAVFNHGRWNRNPRLHEPLYKNLLGRRRTAASGNERESSNAPPQVSHLLLEWAIDANVTRLYWRRQTAGDYSNIDVI
ncbi:hypothetical protein LSAT2_021932 [Lamellibrachia satsuma]|nr:hypothetical protein LSAT2_021932 [Lamellibrachia satsuma]